MKIPVQYYTEATLSLLGEFQSDDKRNWWLENVGGKAYIVEVWA